VSVEVAAVRTVEVPTRIVHGAGAVAHVGELVAELGVTRPLLVTDKPPRVGFAYRIMDRATNKELAFTGVQPLDSFIQKGNPVIPAGMTVNLKDVPPGAYRMTVQAVDEVHNNANPRTIDFDVTD